jgi:hypothetical protein
MIREWDIKRTTFSVGDFLSWQKANALELSPSFQRRSVWTKAQKSYFVDTVYRGLPVPIIFIRERTDVETLSTITASGRSNSQSSDAFDFVSTDDQMIEQRHFKLG